MTQRFWSLLLSSLVVTASVAQAPSAQAQQSDLPTVMVVLPEARHDAMLAALRVELAGEAHVLEGICETECTLASLRVMAEARGASQVVWVTFPQGVIAPAELRVARVASTRAREAMLPSAWDVVEPRVVAAVAANLVASSEPTPEPAPAHASELPQFVPSDAPIASPGPTPAVAEPEPASSESDAPGPFTIQVGFGYGHRHAPGLDAQMTAVPLTLAFYGQLTEWAAVGVRLRGSFGYSSIEGFGGSGLIGVPSLMLTLHEQITPTLGIRWGTHVEGGLNFYGSNFRTWSFGLGVGAYMTLEVGPRMGFQIDYDINMYGFGERGAFFDGMGTLNYVGRFE